jgi:hypothetical protein
MYLLVCSHKILIKFEIKCRELIVDVLNLPALLNIRLKFILKQWDLLRQCYILHRNLRTFRS